VEAYNVDNCQVGIISFGCKSRAVPGAVEIAAEQGIKAGDIRLRTVWQKLFP
ncbi:2-oxoacid:acceptor oxidoreductase subunit alpha, partial [Candidatus Bathyarchaeota archaeon]